MIKSTEKHDVTKFRGRMCHLSECVKGVMFMIQLLRTMKIAVNLPVTIRVDNVGVIFMTSNIITILHTKVCK